MFRTVNDTGRISDVDEIHCSQQRFAAPPSTFSRDWNYCALALPRLRCLTMLATFCYCKTYLVPRKGLVFSLVFFIDDAGGRHS